LDKADTHRDDGSRAGAQYHPDEMFTEKYDIYNVKSSTAKKMNGAAVDEVDDGFQATVNLSSRAFNLTSKSNLSAKSRHTLNPLNNIEEEF